MRKILLAALLALAVAGCAGQGGSIVNPVTDNNVHQLKLAYATALQFASDYRSFCYSKPYADLMASPASAAVCKNRRAVVRQIQKYQPPAGKAVRYVETFVRNNPTLGVASVIGPAWDCLLYTSDA